MGIHILIVDDHTMLRESIAHFLEDVTDDVVVWQAESAKTAFTMLAKKKIDMIMLDLKMPDMDGSTALPMIRKKHAQIPVLMLSASDNPHNMQHCLNAGASGYVEKSESTKTLLHAIHTVLDGNLYIPDALTSHRNEIIEEASRAEKLTTRQLKVLSLLNEGLRNKEIAREIDVSEATVKVHTRDIFRLLGVNNRHHAVWESKRLGLLS